MNAALSTMAAVNPALTVSLLTQHLAAVPAAPGPYTGPVPSASSFDPHALTGRRAEFAGMLGAA